MAADARHAGRFLRLFGVPESEIALSLVAIEDAGVPLDRLEITTCLRRGEIEIGTVFPPETGFSAWPDDPRYDPDLLRNGDIWSTYFDGLFFKPLDKRRNALAFRLIRACGIRIIVTAHGSDVIRVDVPPTRYDWIARMQRDYLELYARVLGGA